MKKQIIKYMQILAHSNVELNIWNRINMTIFLQLIYPKEFKKKV